jgi:putative tricarboxylic transport membrane protein
MEGMFAGLDLLGTAPFWLAFFAAVLMAAFAGLVPGVSASLLMALAVPFIVFTISDPVIGIVMLATITGVEEMLDVLPIVVLGHPGGGQVTFIEARPLVERGFAGRVLGFIYAVSMLGGLIGAVALLMIIPVIKPFILKFSFPEIAAVGLFGVAMVGALSRGAMVKGIAAGAFGLMLSTVGMSVFSGDLRYTFGFLQLREGLPLIATSIGLFALPEMFDLMMTRKPLSQVRVKVEPKTVWAGAKLAVLRYHWLILRHSLLGVFLGAIPGIGSRVVSWLSYGLGISLTRNRRQFGRGSYRGLVFSESVQSAKEGGHAIPTLALGLPGGQSWIFVIVAMITYGISPGPQVLTQHLDIVNLIVVSLVLGNAALALIGILWSGQLVRLTNVPYPLLGAVVIPLTLLSAFLETRHWSAIPIALGFAVLGLLMKQYRWPRPPLILGFILGELIEQNLISAINLYGFFGVVERPLTVGLVVLAIVIAVFFARFGGTGVPGMEAAKTESTHWRWTWLNLFPIFFGLIAVTFVWTAFGFRPVAGAFPIVMGSIVVAACLLQIGINSRGAGDGAVLDLGMLSTGVADRNRSAFILLGLMAGFALLATIAGLQYAAIALAAIMPAFLMVGRRPWAWGLLTGGIIAVVALFFFDQVMSVVWPEPVVLDWLTAKIG